MKLYVDGYGWCEVLELPKLTPREERKWRYVPITFKHCARMRVVLAREIITRYTQPGEVILDPMAGIGTTLIEGALLGHDVVGVELEKKNARTTKWNIGRVEKLKTLVQKGKVQIIQGDSRNLSKLLSRKADSLVFSPPYSDAKKGVADPEDFARRMEEFGSTKGSYHTPGRLRAIGAMCSGYSKDKRNIGNLSYGCLADVAIFSPPFGDSLAGKASDKTSFGNKWRADEDYGKHPAQIGNLPYTGRGKKRETYLQAMLKIYQECFKVLKAGGRMVLILGNLIRNKKIVRLDLDTIQLCEAAGFRFVEAKLFKLPNMSFPRRAYKCRYPDVDTSLTEYEFIQVYEKPASRSGRGGE